MKSQEQPFLSEEEVVAHELVALRCAGDQVLALLGVSLNCLVTSVSPPFDTCKSDLINIFFATDMISYLITNHV